MHTLNVCRLRNVAWATGGHEEGNPLSADVDIRPLSQFKSRLSTDGKKEDIQTHTFKVGLYTVCVSPWRYCLGGAYVPEGMNGCKTKTEKRKRASLCFESKWYTYTFKQEVHSGRS